MKKIKKVLSIVLTLSMVIGLMPVMRANDARADATTTRYEAEDTSIAVLNKNGSYNTRLTSRTGFSTLTGSSTNAATFYTGDDLTYTISVETAGAYTLTLCYAVNTTLSGQIIVNDEVMEHSFTNWLESGNGYITLGTEDIDVTLVEGSNTISIKNTDESSSNFFNFDYIELTQKVTSVYPAAVGKHEAEDAEWNAEKTGFTLQEGDYYSSCSNGKAVGIDAEWQGNIDANERYVYQTVYAETAGQYKLTLAYCTGNQVRLAAKVNDGSWTLYDEADDNGFVPASAGWNVATTATQIITLNAGENTIYLSGCIVVTDWNSEQTGVNLDYFVIEPYSEPEVIPDAVGRHEAENAVSYTQGSASNPYSVEASSNYSGGKAIGSMNTWPANGRAYCTTKVNAATAGTYDMVIAYAGGEADHPCNIDVRVNGGEWISTLAEATADWQTVGTVSLQIELTEGVNEIDVTGACNIWYSGMGWEWINLDYFELSEAISEVTSYKVEIDGTKVADVSAAEGKYVLPTDAAYGYYADGVAYKPGTEITVKEDIALTSINTLSVSVAQGAGIRVNGTPGIRFQATVASDNMTAVADQNVVKEGMLITANDIYENKGELTVDCGYTMKNIENEGWFGTTGTYCGSIINIIESNYIRNFIARAYVTITYSDGTTTEPIYSDYTGVRSIKQVATAVAAAGYPGLDADQIALVDKFAAAK